LTAPPRLRLETPSFNVSTLLRLGSESCSSRPPLHSPFPACCIVSTEETNAFPSPKSADNARCLSRVSILRRSFRARARAHRSLDRETRFAGRAIERNGGKECTRESSPSRISHPFVSSYIGLLARIASRTRVSPFYSG